ncbi:MAG: hybrid sensor histidine kinase/response regulator, partial [Deltaproteobacteria bacterium]|nr:hybrid sensor histidine kinase/response regulator [Deltaproteobacteria bacterium]
YARNETTGAEKADVNILIEKSADIIKAQMKMSNVSLRLDLYPSPLIAKVNKNLFKQVMINLLQNAKDAIEGASRAGTVTVTSTLLPYMSMRILISDDGPGIPEDIIDKIFDPFFTTKDVGKGTGLGLSVSRKIIEKMGGQIGVESASRRGTTFAITFPHCGEAIDERRRERMRNPDQSFISGKTVLIADDEPEILNALKDAVSPHVSRVDAAANGTEALERIKANDYDIVLLDINMPGMNGMEVFKALSCLKPGLAHRVIFLTGDTENKKTSDFLKLAGCRYLCKPLGTNEILNAMCEVAGKFEASSKTENKEG